MRIKFISHGSLCVVCPIILQHDSNQLFVWVEPDLLLGWFTDVSQVDACLILSNLCEYGFACIEHRFVSADFLAGEAG